MTDEQAILAGQRAKSFVDDPIFRKAMDGVREGLMQQFREKGDPDGKLFQTLQNLDSIEEQILSVHTEGILAADRVVKARKANKKL
jgi:hypothetical protein